MGSKIFSFIDIFMPTYQRSPKTETVGPPGERVQPFAIPAHPCCSKTAAILKIVCNRVIAPSIGYAMY